MALMGKPSWRGFNNENTLLSGLPLPGDLQVQHRGGKRHCPHFKDAEAEKGSGVSQSQSRATAKPGAAVESPSPECSALSTGPHLPS